MDRTYRFRFLIYFAAFMLFMSLCFVYAEPLPSSAGSMRTSFLNAGDGAALSQTPVFDAAALRTASAPIVPQAALEDLQNAVHHRHGHGFFHHVRPTAMRAAPGRLPSTAVSAADLVSPLATR